MRSADTYIDNVPRNSIFSFRYFIQEFNLLSFYLYSLCEVCCIHIYGDLFFIKHVTYSPYFDILYYIL